MKEEPLKEELERLRDSYENIDLAMEQKDEAELQVGIAIRKAREAKGVSLRSFAAKVGVSASYMSDIELGNRFPADKTLKAIIKYL